MLSRTSRVKVYSFSGADTSDMHDFLKPLIKKKLSRIIAHCGTNNLASKQVQNIMMSIKDLANTITSGGIDCTVSGLMVKDDGLAYTLHLNKQGTGRLAFNLFNILTTEEPKSRHPNSSIPGSPLEHRNNSECITIPNIWSTY